MRYRYFMYAASFAPSLPFLDTPRLSVKQSPIFWAVLASVIVHGMALGWLPGLRQAQEMMSKPLSVLLPPPVAEPVAVPPAPTPPQPVRRTDVPTPTPTPVLTRSAPAPASDAPTVAQAPVAAPVAAPEAVTAPAVSQAAPVVPASRPATTDPAALAAYGRNLAGAVAAHQRYPRLAQIRQWQGTALLQLELAADGQLASVRVLSSSGHEILDRQAIDMVRAAVPLPPLPASLAGRSLTVDVPVVFRLAS
jgi:periplasmic protein TonB